MSVSWQIKGEAGKAFDDTLRTLDASLAVGAVLSFQSLADDTLTLDFEPEDIDTATIPELRQQVELYRNGTRYFHGYVTQSRDTMSAGSMRKTIVVSGVWWWLERIAFTQIQTDGTGATAERISYVFGNATSGQDLKTSLESAINRCAALGAPVATVAAGSSVASIATYPRITLNQSNCAQVLTELVRLCPDAMLYFDYTAKPATCHVTRRTTCTTKTLDLLTDGIEQIDIQPVIELQVSKVELPYVTRSATGLTQYASQSYGTGTNESRQVITISGPELDTFLPNDLFDSQVVTAGLLTNSASLKSLWLARTPSVSQSAGGDTGYIVLGESSQTWILWGKVTWTGTPTNAIKTDPRYYFPPVLSLVNEQGTAISTAGKYFAIEDLTDWAASQLGMSKGILTGAFVLLVGGDQNTLPNSWVWKSGYTDIIQGYYFNGSSWVVGSVVAWKFEIDVWYRSTALSSGTIYRDADYSFITPPAGLAQHLQTAQSFLPWEGTITKADDEALLTRYSGSKINIDNSLAAHATMGALVAGESIDIASGVTTINIGSAPRIDYKTLVDRIRKTSQDNIVYV